MRGLKILQSYTERANLEFVFVCLNEQESPTTSPKNDGRLVSPGESSVVDVPDRVTTK